ncbi:hypothetical protein A3770_10p59580 [Chloropicon primus]|uniref:Sialyltransferase n=1 Tax=Chloropicon primus TaxID=1764295 RepID=A0A5B8MVH7_9CHLO|nr:hypothetical protein A3770_10p59580 [Chloropicon primus]|eukprot:QDZ23440.1 hypothetical protein A3770_10p59580 [Chloropicon primus]
MDMDSRKEMEERIKILEDAVRKSNEEGKARWSSMLKVAAVCVVLIIIVLILLGPLLPAVYTLEYVAKGGAFKDQGVVPGAAAKMPGSGHGSPPAEASPPLVEPQPAPPKKGGKRKGGKAKASQVAGSTETRGGPANAQKEAAIGGGDGGAGDSAKPAPELKEGQQEEVSDRLKQQREVCLGAPYPVIFGDGGATRDIAFKAYASTRSSRGYLRNNKLDPVLVAVENEKKGGGRGLQGKADSLPLRPFCGRRRRPVTGNLEELTECLMTPDKCTPAKQANATVQLNKVSAIKQYLPQKGLPKCLTVNKACGVRPRDLTSAKESGKKIGPKAGERIVRKQPDEDISRSMKTCAIVANGPGLYAGGIGEAIDAHDVVIKMNLYHLGQRPGKFQELDKSASLYSGTKSSIRMFNAKRAEDALKYTMMPSANETWIYWHYRTAMSLDALIKVNPNSRFLSPQHLDRMIELYFAFRTLVIQIAKIRRTKCPINLSTGIHSVLTYIHTCDRVNLFGFSTRWSDMTGRGRRDEVISSRMSRSHDWNVDVMILNLLAISGKINFCTQ